MSDLLAPGVPVLNVYTDEYGGMVGRDHRGCPIILFDLDIGRYPMTFFCEAVDVLPDDPETLVARLLPVSQQLVLRAEEIADWWEQSARDAVEAAKGGQRVACWWCDGEFYRPDVESGERAVCRLCRYKEGG